MAQTSSESHTKIDSLIVDTIYDSSIKQWLLRTNDVGAKAIRFVYEQRNLLKDKAESLEIELSFCSQESIVQSRIIAEQNEIISAKKIRIENAQKIISVKDDSEKQLKKRLFRSHVREVLFGVVGISSIAYGIYITVK